MVRFAPCVYLAALRGLLPQSVRCWPGAAEMKNALIQTTNESAPDKANYNRNDLFPDTLPPVVPAFWPSTGTRAYEALLALIEAPQNQADYWESWRLSAYVKSLEYDGWSFNKRNITKPGCRRPITEYSLNRDDPGTAAALAMRQGGGRD